MAQGNLNALEQDVELEANGLHLLRRSLEGNRNRDHCGRNCLPVGDVSGSVQEYAPVTQSEYPPCACSIHPSGEDKRKYMYVAECTQEFVVFCCKRCSEMARTAVIQVRTLKSTRDKAKYLAEQDRKSLPPQVRAMLNKRVKGRVRYERNPATS